MVAWIIVVEDSEAKGKLKQVYDRIKREFNVAKLSKIHNILKLHSLNPRALLLGIQFFWWLMRGESRLTFAQREMIAAVGNRHETKEA